MAAERATRRPQAPKADLRTMIAAEVSDALDKRIDPLLARIETLMDSKQTEAPADRPPVDLGRTLHEPVEPVGFQKEFPGMVTSRVPIGGTQAERLRKRGYVVLDDPEATKLGFVVMGMEEERHRRGYRLASDQMREYLNGTEATDDADTRRLDRNEIRHNTPVTPEEAAARLPLVSEAEADLIED